MKYKYSIVFFCLTLISSCGQQTKLSTIHTLPMDSSIAVIMEATRLLNDACVPMCWPRDFSTKKIATHYVAYVMRNKPGQQIRGIPSPIRFGSDSSFHPLFDYAANVALQEINEKDINPLSNRRVKVELADGLKGNLTDDKLGYITVSPVTINQKLNQGVFFYELRGEFYSSWMVCIRRKQNRWIIVRKELLSIS